MSRSKLFFENIIIYGLGGMLAKLVPLIMLPVVTRLIPDASYFGLSDLSNTLVQFAQAFAIMGMYDAMFRLFFEKDDLIYKKEICSTALYFVTASSLMIAICIFLFQDPLGRLFFGGTQYASLLVVSAISTFIGGNSSIIQAPTRMMNKRVVFVVMNFVTALFTYAAAIPLLLYGEYLLALPIATAVASALGLLIFLLLNRKWFSISCFKIGHLSDMLKIGLPLMPNFLVYWIFTSASRLIIVASLGATVAGIFAVSAKLGQVSQLIYTAFAQGWQFFAFSTMKDDDQIELTGKIFEYLAVVSFVAASIFILVNPLVYPLLFDSQYQPGMITSCYLFVAPLLLMLYQVGSNQFLVIKKTWPNLLILLAGSLLTIGLCFWLVPLIGIEGAGIATLAGYVLSVILCVSVLLKRQLIVLDVKVSLVSALFAAYCLVWRLMLSENILLTAISSCLFIGAILYLYRNELSLIGSKLKSKLSQRKRM